MKRKWMVVAGFLVMGWSLSAWAGTLEVGPGKRTKIADFGLRNAE